MQFLTQGYEMNATEILQSAMFSEDYSQMVLVKEIEFTLVRAPPASFFWESSHSLYSDGIL